LWIYFFVANFNSIFLNRQFQTLIDPMSAKWWYEKEHTSEVFSHPDHISGHPPEWLDEAPAKTLLVKILITWHLQHTIYFCCVIFQGADQWRHSMVHADEHIPKCMPMNTLHSVYWRTCSMVNTGKHIPSEYWKTYSRCILINIFQGSKWWSLSELLTDDHVPRWILACMLVPRCIPIYTYREH